MLTLSILAALLIVGLLLGAISIWLGARWLRASHPTLLRAFSTTIIISIVNGIGWPIAARLQTLVDPDNLLAAILFSLALLVIDLFLSCLIIKGLLGLTLLRSALVWLISLIPGLAMLAGVFLVLKPFVLEAFVLPSNPMAPTLTGWHKIEKCPHCGNELFVPWVAPGEQVHWLPDEEQWGICDHCLRTARLVPTSQQVVGADRFMANKLLAPERWDVIVFRYPREPSSKYAMRLVGLPGEHVFIKEGAVWVNGARLSPPEAIANLQYTTEVVDGIPMPIGTEDQPWRLKDDEYCVLGDFTQRSSDSRFWGPVPIANVEAVATVRYWPLARFKVWR